MLVKYILSYLEQQKLFPNDDSMIASNFVWENAQISRQ